MALVDRVFALTIMALILLFSVIHLGVSIGLIVKDRKYGDFFRPQIGLSSFNLVIFIFSLFTGIFGILALALNSERFARIVCILSGVVGIFALASLIAALVISDKSPNYVHSRFMSGQKRYQTDLNLRNKIDLLQTKYECCGNDLWIDWANADLNGTSVTTTTTVSANDSTTTMMTTTTVTNSTVESVTSSTTVSTISSTSETSTSTVVKRKRDLDDILRNKNEQDFQESIQHSRNKRQGVSNYGNILGLPVTFSILLPQSCCTAQAVLTSNSSNAYCISYQSDIVNNFRTRGCARLIERDAGNQAMAFILINSFMVVLSFMAIPVMLGKPSDMA